MLPVLIHSGAALLAIGTSWFMLQAFLGGDRLPRLSFPCLKDGGDFYTLFPIYFFSGTLTVGFGAVIWGGIRLNADTPLYVPAFLTMTVVGSFRMLCVMVPGTSPNTIAVWLMGTIAAGAYGLFLGFFPEGAIMRSIGANGRVFGNVMLVITSGSFILAIAVELFIAVLKIAQERGWVQKPFIKPNTL